MELRQLEYFQMVSRLNNITRAAEALHVSQPSITNSIKNLERELGVTLFDRTKKQIQLTTEGKVFLTRVDNILNQINDAVTEMMDYKQFKRGILRIGIPPMIGTFLFPHIFVNFKKLYPEIELFISENGSISTRQLIEKGELDLGIVIISESSKLLETLSILNSEILVCLNKHHPLCKNPEIQFENIKKEPVIMLKEGFYHRQKILEYYYKYNIEPNVVLSSNQLETIKSLIINGIGVSFLLKEIVESDERIVSLPLSEPINLEIGLAWKKDKYLSNVSKAFIDFILNSYKISEG